ncbi:MAG: hypothetical protein ACOC2U_02745 [bacterium]
METNSHGLNELEVFLKCEKKLIEKQKENVDKCISADSGQDYILNWIQMNADWFRKKWKNSCCKSCNNVLDCGYKLRTNCKNYEE